MSAIDKCAELVSRVVGQTGEGELFGAEGRLSAQDGDDLFCARYFMDGNKRRARLYIIPHVGKRLVLPIPMETSNSGTRSLEIRDANDDGINDVVITGISGFQVILDGASVLANLKKQ